MSEAVVATETPQAPRPPSQRRRRPSLATGALAALSLAAGVLLVYAGRHLTFFYDEWEFILTRRGETVGTYLDPHNGHLSLFPVIVYKILFGIFGLRHYTPYRIVVIALHLLCAALLYVLARRRIGDWAALVPATLLLFLGSAWQDLLWPFQIGYLGSMAGGLGALVLLDRPGRRADLGAFAMLVWAVASSGVGLAFVVACGVLLIAQRARWVRLWVVIAPLVLYGLWYVGWGGGDQTTSSAVLGAPQYVATAAGSAVAGIAGLDPASWGAPLAVGLLALIALEWRRAGRGPATPMLLTAIAGALVFWVLAAVARADAADPTASRYVYIGAVFILLAVSEARLGLALRGLWLALAGLLVAGALVANLGNLRAGERGLRFSDTSVRAALGAVQIAQAQVSPAFVADPVNAPEVTAGAYLAAVKDLGSPAYTVSELERTPESIREKADTVLAHAERLGLTPTAAPPTGSGSLAVEAAYGARLTGSGACRTLVPLVSLASLQVRVGPGQAITVQTQKGSSASVYLRRFASSFFSPALDTVNGGSEAELRVPVDRAPALPWSVQLVSGNPATLCAA